MDKSTHDKTKNSIKNEDGQNNEKASKNMGKRIRIGSLLIFLFILVYIPSLLNWLHGKNIASDILRIGLIEQSVNADGVIIRDETLLMPSPFDGKYLPEVSEGERVPAFYRVATVLNKSSDGLLKELEEVNVKIVETQNEKAKSADFFSEDIAKVDKEIGQKVESISVISNSSSYSGLGDIEKDIAKLMEKKAEITGEGSGDAVLASLKQQKASIQSRIDNNTGQITTEFSGAISFVIDGYENTLAPKAIKNLTVAYIERVKNVSVPNEPTYDTAEAGKPLAKVIKGSEFYIAAVIDQSEAEKYKAGKEINVRINDIGLETKATVSDIYKKDGGKCIISIELNKGMNELISLRKVNIDIISSSSEGLKVPVKCLENYDLQGGTAWITIIKANVASKRKIDVVSSNNEFAIVKTPENELKQTVNLYDTYILNPGNVKDGEIIQK